MLEFRLLGPLEVLADGTPVALPRLKQRALLAALVLRAGEVVSVDRLIEDLWGWDAPPRAKAALQNYVSQLRKMLGAETLTTRPPGYVIDVGPEQVDLARFERLHASARGQEPAEREATLRTALGLFRGPPLADLVFEPFAEREIARIEELALVAREDLVDVGLSLGRHTEAVPELESLITRHPYRERLRGMLMLALYRSGRQAEALQAYQHARHALVDELGIEPGEVLQELERSILRQDPSLRAPVPGEPAVPARPRRATRKTVTVLATAHDGSLLSEALDAEPARDWLDRIALAGTSVVERHRGHADRAGADGGSIVFGVPVVREDDALRAVRAAHELRDELERLEAELVERHGLRLRPRIAVATGDVLVTEDLVVTGEPAAAAARLAARSMPGDVAVDATTLALVRHAVTVDETAGGARLLELSDDPRPLRLDAPLVGRERQLAVLGNAFTGVVADRRLHLVTVVGTAGVGKSRLVREFSQSLGGDATRLYARCLPHGESTGFRPLLEMLGEEHTGERWDGAPRAHRRRLVDALMGDSRAERGHEARTLLEGIARRRPVVLVIEDLHAAAGSLLDLIDDVADWSTGAPILLLCTTRPELFESRASWGGGKPSATSLALEALDDEGCSQLVDALLGEPDLPDPVRAYIIEVSGGNPLFVEELLATLVEREVLTRKGGRWTSQELPTIALPSSITALLAARIDRLPAHERELLDLASVLGRRFTPDLLARLADEDLGSLVDPVLASLGRKELIRAVEEVHLTFEFRHELVRDAAYASLPKRTRAALHDRLADLLVDSREADDDALELGRFHRALAEAYRAEVGSEESRG